MQVAKSAPFWGCYAVTTPLQSAETGLTCRIAGVASLHNNALLLGIFLGDCATINLALLAVRMWARRTLIASI